MVAVDQTFLPGLTPATVGQRLYRSKQRRFAKSGT